MTQVSPSQSQPGTEIKAQNINDPVNQITAVINGNLDDQNISSVSGSKIAAGTVSYEKMSTPVAFGAYQSTSISIPVTTFTRLIFQTEEFDDGNVYDHTTGRFTATSAGIYSISAACALEGTGDTNRMFTTLYKNGTEFKRGNRIHASAFDVIASTVTATVKLSPGDYIEVFVWQSAGAAKTTRASATETWFNGHRVR